MPGDGGGRLLIVGAATVAGVRTMYSEDVSNGQVYGEVQVVNPFL